MRIGLNLLYLLPGIVGGTETYAAGLLRGLARVDPGDEFIVFVNRESKAWPLPAAPNFTRVVCPIAAMNRGQRYLFEQAALPNLIRRHRVDVVHSLGYVGPLAAPCPAVVTIPDVNYIDLADTLSLSRRIFLRLFSVGSARLAAHIIAISGFTERRLREALGIAVQRISVTYLGPREPDYAAQDSEPWQELAQCYNIRQPYVVAFGGGARHKNIPRLIEAFAALGHQFPHTLVLLGHLPPNVDLNRLSNDSRLRGRVLATGYVPDHHLLPLLSHAELFIVPSLYEGFGLPVLEAQQAGVAVACSTAASLPEIAGDGAAYFDPTSLDAIGDAMRRCLSSPELRADLRRRGAENLKRFSWDQTARDTLAVYRSAVNL